MLITRKRSIYRDVTMKVPSDPAAARLPRWQRGLRALQVAGPRQRVALLCDYVMRLLLGDVVVVSIKTLMFNKILLPVWVWMLKGRVEFFGHSGGSIGDMALTPDYYLLRKRELKSNRISVYLVNKPAIANCYFAKVQADAFGSRRVRFVLNRFLCRVLEPLEQPLFFAPRGHIDSRYPPAYNALLSRHNFHLERRVPASDRRLAREWMETLGLPREAKFVAVHVREAGFKAHVHTDGHNTSRDADIAAYLPAIRYMTQQGFWVIRMGEATVKPLPAMERAIDYARSPLKSDFLDVVLLAECEFLLGSPSGLAMVADVLNKPQLFANAIGIYALPCQSSALWLPKRVWSRSERCYLTLAEIIERGIGEFGRTQQYVAAGLEVHDNSAEEILDATQELYRRVCGQSGPSPEIRAIQQAVQGMLPPHYLSHGTQVLLCETFIRRHPELCPAPASSVLQTVPVAVESR